MSRSRDLGRTVPPEKLRALADVLERDRRVVFRNGSVVELSDCVECHGAGDVATGATLRFRCRRCAGVGTWVLVRRLHGGIARYNRDTELLSAYVMALRGPISKPGWQTLAEKAERFGDAPF